MENKEKNYLVLIILHIVIGIAIYLLPVISKIYAALILTVSLYFIIKTRNRNNEVLYASAYVVGSEVFLRMTEGNPNHEFSKYSVILYCVLGMFYSGFSKYAMPYWIFLLCLLPGVFIGIETLSFETASIRKTIFFNISGPVCLGIASLYCYNKKIKIEELNNIILLLGLPVISCAVYLFFYTPDSVLETLSATGSNGDLTGGFGPNQVSTALGLGMFVFFSRVLLNSEKKIFFLINLFFAAFIGYRGLLTFSRGGMITGFAMILTLLLVIYLYIKKASKLRFIYIFVFLIVAFSLIWVYTENKTGGLISKRYANQDALGRTKTSKFSGREDLAAGEYNMFLENPFFGVGAGRGTDIRRESMGDLYASHDEVTRLLAEHGFFGILSLLILIMTPLILFLDNKQHIFMFCFLLYWFLTINHAAMRTASPSFIYALCLLKVRFKDEETQPTLYRK